MRRKDSIKQKPSEGRYKTLVVLVNRSGRLWQEIKGKIMNVLECQDKELRLNKQQEALDIFEQDKLVSN